MSIVKSFAVGDGDMFYLRHASDNFTIIDCSLPNGNRSRILNELKDQSRDKAVVRFISTHPDDDHICGLCELDEEFALRNFYCVRTRRPNLTGQQISSATANSETMQRTPSTSRATAPGVG
jgi:glyoxylase-like metal-dependent hydrolase (beta-lactamase superfamily II)